MGEGERFFFEKKNQKTFVPYAVSIVRIVLATLGRLKQLGRESFLVLFFKKGLLAFACLALIVMSAAAAPEGMWFTEDRGGVVKIQPCGAALCGIIVGLSDFPADGVKRDVHGNTQCHYTLLDNLRLEDDARWHGTVTNPEDGRTYSAQVWVPADGTLRLRGFIGLPILGSTQLWPRFSGKILADCHFSG